MDWQTTVPDLASVPEQYHALYSREGDEGDYTLDAGVAKLVDERATLNRTVSAVRKERDDAKAVAGKLKAAGFDDVDAVTARIAELEAEANKASNADELVEKRLKEANEKFERERAADREALEKSEQRLKDELVGRQIAEAVSKTKCIPEALKLLLQPRLRVVDGDNGPEVQGVSDDGEAIYGTDGKPLDAVGMAEHLLAKDSYNFAVDPVHKSGGGGTGNNPPGGTTGANPFATANGQKPNMTEIARLLKDNPARAQAQAAQAGFDLSQYQN